MTLSDLASRYICSAESVLSRVQVTEDPVTVDSSNVRNTVDFAKVYLEDAKYYREKKKFEVSLSCITYCEGLLDALRLLGVVSFEWPTRQRKRNRSGR
jgi:FAD synthetase